MRVFLQKVTIQIVHVVTDNT